MASRRRQAPLCLVVGLLALLVATAAPAVADSHETTTTTDAPTTAAPTTAAPTTAAPTTAAPTTAAPTTAAPTTVAPTTVATTTPAPTAPPANPSPDPVAGPAAGPAAPAPGAPAPAAPAAPRPVDTKAEDSSEEPPPRIAVPPRTTPRVVTPVDQAVAKVLDEQLKQAELAAKGALAAAQAAERELAVLEAEQAALKRTFSALHADEAAAAQRLVEQRQQMRTRAVAIYVSGPGEPVIPAGGDIHEFGRRRVLVKALHAADRRTLDRYLEAKKVAGGDIDAIVDRLEDLNGKVLAARARTESRAASTQTGFRSVGRAKAGGRLAISGFAFPVAEPFNFVSTFGAPRSGGRLHQGNDIFAPYGTPLYAAERGVVGQMGTNSLGGIKLWITGESSTSYYYAHLSAFALNVNDGTLVEAGDIVGFVGNTGNAITTPPHLHFEIHPGGGPAIDPYPILKAAADATRQLPTRQLAAPTSATTTAPTSAPAFPTAIRNTPDTPPAAVP